MKKKLNYIVTFTGQYAHSGRMPIQVKVHAHDVKQATEIAYHGLSRDTHKPVDLVLFSVVPVLDDITTFHNVDSELEHCPFCGNTDVSLVETFTEYYETTQHIVVCGCCGASMPPESEERAIQLWNQREEPEALETPHEQ